MPDEIPEIQPEDQDTLLEEALKFTRGEIPELRKQKADMIPKAIRKYIPPKPRSVSKSPIKKEDILTDSKNVILELGSMALKEDGSIQLSQHVRELVDTEIEEMQVEELAKLSDSVAKKFKLQLAQEIIIKLADRANQIGNAYLVKEILREKERYMYLLRCHANGYTYQETAIDRRSGEEFTRIVTVPSNLNAVIKALSYIDNSKPAVIAKQINRKEEKENIDEIINNQNGSTKQK